MFEVGKVNGIELSEARLQFEYCDHFKHSSFKYLSLVELSMPEVELAFECSSKLQRFWLTLLSERQYREKKQTLREDLANFEPDDFDKHEVAFIIW